MGKLSNFNSEGSNIPKGKRLLSNVALSEELIQTGQAVDNYKYLFSVIYQCIDNKKYKTALKLTNSLLKVLPDDGNLWMARGVCFSALLDFTSAINSIKKAIRINPLEKQFVLDLAAVYLECHQLPEANTAIAKLLNTHAVDSELLYHIAEVYCKHNFFSQAIQYFEYYLERVPEAIDTLFQIAFCYDLQKAYETAIHCYNKYLEKKPDSYIALFNSGILFEKLERFDAAIESYENTILVNPQFTDAYLNLANLLADLDRFDESIEIFNKLILLLPNDATTQFNLGTIFETKYDYPKAIEHFSKATQLDSQFVEAYLERGYSKLRLGDFTGATDDFRKCLSFSFEGNDGWKHFDENNSPIDENDISQYSTTDFESMESDQFIYDAKINLLIRLRKYNEAIYFSSCRQSLSNIGKFDYFSVARIHFIKKNSLLGFLYLQKSFNYQPEVYRVFKMLFPKIAASKLFEGLFKVRLTENIFQ